MAGQKIAEIDGTWRNVWGWIKFVFAVAFWRFFHKSTTVAAMLTALALVLGACGGPAPAGEPLVEEPTTGDTGPTTAPDAAPAVRPDALPSQPAPDAGHADAAPQLQPDAGHPATQPEAGTATPDSAPASDAAPSSDAAPAADAAPTAAPVCDSALPSCQAAVKADTEIRATFTQSCGTSAPQCGGVLEDGHIVVTYPMLCTGGSWRLAGSWNGEQWVSFTCSRGCGAAGVLCQP